MDWKIEVFNKKGVSDPVSSGIKKDILDLGIKGVTKVTHHQVFIISGDITESDVKRIAEELLVDSIIQSYRLIKDGRRTRDEGRNIVEVAYNPGVMDPVEESTRKAIKDMGIYGVESIKTEKKYYIDGNIAGGEFKTLCEKLLYNKVIQHVVTVDSPQSTVHSNGYQFKLITVDILGADDRKLIKISKDGQLFLNLEEMKAIKKYFKKIRRNPTDCELETIAQTWSEHCAHKTFRGVIDYKEARDEGRLSAEALAKAEGTKDEVKIGNRKINNLLKSTIMKATKELDKSWCVSVFEDNAGIIRFDEEDNVCFKVETHNHPSALEPYGGAGTGVGGVIRDILGVGLASKPIMNTDVFCFGEPDTANKDVPQGMLHPKRIAKGVVSGVRDYGNRMGIPTSNGAVLFDKGYTGNPLVYCGTVGIMPKDKSFKCAQTGDFIVAIGGRTGRDGIHGATFSSGELTHESEIISGGAVQIGNPITEKKVLDTLIKARDRNLFNSITDCGAGGFSSAIGEMGKDLGAEVDLEKAPLKYEGLTYTEIWISEAQERMVLAVPRHNITELTEIFNKEDVETAVIGYFTSDKRLRLRYNGEIVCDLDMEFLHDGIPQFERQAIWEPKKHNEFKRACHVNLNKDLLKILSSWNVASKEWIIRQYDHEVQGQSVLKPLTGVNNDGPSDASVIRPKFNSKKGVIVANGLNPRYGFIDPYWMSASCIDEALRQVVSVGGSLKHTAILDNFCWGNTDKPDRLGSLVRASLGCYDIAKGYGVPFISGKDSLNNEYRVNGKSVPIPGTLLISAISVIDDVEKVVSMDFKEAGNLVYIVGMTYKELGGSHYYLINGCVGNDVPKVDIDMGIKIFSAINKAINYGLVRSCHDCSEGGIGVAAAEMAFSGGLGVEVELGEVPYKYDRRPFDAPRRFTSQSETAGLAQGKQTRDEGRNMKGDIRNDFVLFSESNTRFIVEIKKENRKKFELIMKGIPIGLIGAVKKEKGFKVKGIEGSKIVDIGIDELKEAWQKPLRW